MWLVACERCGVDRYLPFYAPPYWYCEFNPDPNADRCQPTADVPLRTGKAVKSAQSSNASSSALSMPDAHAEEMLEVFGKFKREGIEREVALSSGWMAIYKKRKRGDGTRATIRPPSFPLSHARQRSPLTQQPRACPALRRWRRLLDKAR